MFKELCGSKSSKSPFYTLVLQIPVATIVIQVSQNSSLSSLLFPIVFLLLTFYSCLLKAKPPVSPLWLPNWTDSLPTGTSDSLTYYIHLSVWDKAYSSPLKYFLHMYLTSVGASDLSGPVSKLTAVVKMKASTRATKVMPCSSLGGGYWTVWNKRITKGNQVQDK